MMFLQSLARIPIRAEWRFSYGILNLTRISEREQKPRHAEYESLADLVQGLVDGFEQSLRGKLLNFHGEDALGRK